MNRFCHLADLCCIGRISSAAVIALIFGSLSVTGARAQGEIVGWGQYVVVSQAELQGLVAVSAGGQHSLGLKSDGSIVAWGDNQYCECDVPEPNTGFVAVSAGLQHGLGLKSGGEIVAWGNNYYGQCNVPSPNAGFVAVSAGDNHSLGLKSDGSIVAWGYNSYGQCNVPSPNTGFVAVSGGGDHSFGLKSGGSIVAWGRNYEGQCNVPSPNTGFVAVSAGWEHGLGLKPDGSIVAWGDNHYGECSVPSPNTGFVAVSGGGVYSLGLKSDGSIVAWGDNFYGQCNVPSPNAGFAAVSAGSYHSLGLKSSGALVAWGTNYSGQCNGPSPNSGFVAVSAGWEHSLGLKSDGSIVAWGDMNEGECNVPSPNAGFVAVSAGWLYSLGLKSDGSIVAWGRNDEGQCNVPSPNAGFVAVSSGGQHSLGLKSDGSIVGWGYNYYGQRNVPSPNSGFVAVSAGWEHSLGLKSDGSIVAWGWNGSGACNVPSPNAGFVAVSAGYGHSLGLKSSGSIVAWGDNSDGACNVPSPNAGFVAVSAGNGFSLGLKSDSSIIAWGYNYERECNVPSPNTGFIAMSAGYWHSLSVRVTEIPAAPSNLVASTQGPNSIHLQWHDTSLNERSFEVWRKDGEAGGWACVKTLGPNCESWVNEGLTCGSTYSFKVRACNVAGCSEWSNAMSVVPWSVPSTPRNLRVASATPTSVSLVWDHPSYDEVGFRVYRKAASDTGYVWIGSSPADSVGCCHDTGVTKGAEYSYYVLAYNAHAYSGASDTVSATVPIDQGVFTLTLRVSRCPSCRDVVAGARAQYLDTGDNQWHLVPNPSDSGGLITIPNMKPGFKVRVWKDDLEPSIPLVSPPKSYLPFNAALTISADSDTIDKDGNYWPLTLTDDMRYHCVSVPLIHPIIQYNLSVSLDFVSSEDYMQRLVTGFGRAGRMIYDASDGQMLLKNVAIHDRANPEFAEYTPVCDVVVHEGLKRKWATSSPKYNHESGVFTPPMFQGGQNIRIDISEDSPYGPLGFVGHDPSNEDWYAAFVHEFFHYSLGLLDEYCNGSELGHHKTSADPLNPLCNASRYWCSRMSGLSLKEYPESYGIMDFEQTWNSPRDNEELSCSLDYPEDLFAGDMSEAPQQASGPNVLLNGVLCADRRLAGPCWDVLGAILNCYTSGSPSVLMPPQGNIGWQWFPSLKGISGKGKRPGPDALPDYLSDLPLITFNGEPRSASSGPSGTAKRQALSLTTENLSYGVHGLVVQGTLVSVQPKLIEFTLQFQDSLSSPPAVRFEYGMTVTGSTAVPGPGARQYRCWLTVDPTDSLFSGYGWLRVAARADAGDSILVTSRWACSDAFEKYPCAVSTPAFAWLLDSSRGKWPTSELITETDAASFGFPAGLAQAGPIVSIDAPTGGLLPTGSLLEGFYGCSDQSGMDLAGAVMHKWDWSSGGWVPIASSLIDSVFNVALVEPTSPGVYVVLAPVSLDSIAPARISDLGVTPGESDGLVVLDFTAPGDDGGAGQAMRYVLGYSDVPFTQSDWDSLSQTVLPERCQAGGTQEVRQLLLPKPGHKYFVAIRTQDEAGNLAPLSNVTYAFSGFSDPNFLPDPPGAFRSIDVPADSGGRVLLTWQKSHDDGAGKGTVREYRIYRNMPPLDYPVPLDTLAAGTTSYVDSSAVTGKVYTYWVSAADSIQERFSAQNRAMAARNVGVPAGDFDSDGRVSIKDFSLFVDTYGIDSTDSEYDPLFDLDHNGSIYTGDFDSLSSRFGEGGLPVADPVGKNNRAQLLYSLTQGEGTNWYLDFRVVTASELAGYSFKVTFAPAGLAFVSAAPESGGLSSNMLNRNGGHTPLFLASARSPGIVYIAQAIKQPSSSMGVAGDGFVTRLIFSGSDASSIHISDAVTMDCERGLNIVSITTAGLAGHELKAPMLYQNFPNPFMAGTTVRFYLPSKQSASIKLYDVEGKLVKTLVDAVTEPGMHQLQWDGKSGHETSVAPGIYFIRMESGSYRATKKVVLVR